MGLISTSARILRAFAISSRSPLRRPNALGKSMLPAAAGGSSGEDIGPAAGAAVGSDAVCGFAGSVVAVGSAFLLHAANKRRANKGIAKVRVRRAEVEVVDIHLLR